MFHFNPNFFDWHFSHDQCFRYTCILHNEYYNKLFGVKGTVISMIILWVCVVLLDLPNWSFLGFGSHAYSDFGMHCTFAFTTNFFYNTVMYTGLAVLFPAIVILFCYLNIWIRTSSNHLFEKHRMPTIVKKTRVIPIKHQSRNLRDKIIYSN